MKCGLSSNDARPLNRWHLSAWTYGLQIRSFEISRPNWFWQAGGQPKSKSLDGATLFPQQLVINIRRSLELRTREPCRARWQEYSWIDLQDSSWVAAARQDFDLRADVVDPIEKIDHPPDNILLPIDLPRVPVQLALIKEALTFCFNLDIYLHSSALRQSSSPHDMACRYIHIYSIHRVTNSWALIGSWQQKRTPASD